MGGGGAVKGLKISAFCNKNVTTNDHFRAYNYTGQRNGQLVSQRNCETSCKKDCLVKRARGTYAAVETKEIETVVRQLAV